MSEQSSSQALQDKLSSSSPESVATDTPTGTSAAVRGPQTGRKRKVLEPVTSNACTNCKRARAKVGDGNAIFVKLRPTYIQSDTDRSKV